MRRLLLSTFLLCTLAWAGGKRDDEPVDPAADAPPEPPTAALAIGRRVSGQLFGGGFGHQKRFKSLWGESGKPGFPSWNPYVIAAHP